MASSVVFVGNLPNDVRDSELHDIFKRYGRIRNVDIKWPPKPPPFAFVEYDDPRDAEDAVRNEDQKSFAGARMRVEIARGGRRGREDDRGGDRGGFRDDFRRGRSDRRGQGHRLTVRNVPPGTSWQDLKDYFRKVAPPSFVDIHRDRDGATGVVEFMDLEDAKEACRKLDDTEFRGRGDESAYIRVEMDEDRKRDMDDRKDDRNGGDRDRSPRDRDDDKREEFRRDDRDDRERDRSRER